MSKRLRKTRTIVLRSRKKDSFYDLTKLCDFIIRKGKYYIGPGHVTIARDNILSLPVLVTLGHQVETQLSDNFGCFSLHGPVLAISLPGSLKSYAQDNYPLLRHVAETLSVWQRIYCYPMINKSVPDEIAQGIMRTWVTIPKIYEKVGRPGRAVIPFWRE